MPRPIYKNNDHRVRITNLRTIDGVVVSDAEVSYVLTKKEDGEVVGTGTLTATATPGQYQTTIDRTVTTLVEQDVQYLLTVTAVNDDGDDGEWVSQCYGALRSF